VARDERGVGSPGEGAGSGDESEHGRSCRDRAPHGRFGVFAVGAVVFFCVVSVAVVSVVVVVGAT
jgi:hypothetical protein